jgi:hypothetical protein
MKLHLLEQVMEEVLKEMPAFPENRESAPEARLREKLEAAEKGALGNEKRGTDHSNTSYVQQTVQRVFVGCSTVNLVYLTEQYTIVMDSTGYSCLLKK